MEAPVQPLDVGDRKGTEPKADERYGKIIRGHRVTSCRDSLETEDEIADAVGEAAPLCARR